MRKTSIAILLFLTTAAYSDEPSVTLTTEQVKDIITKAYGCGVIDGSVKVLKGTGRSDAAEEMRRMGRTGNCETVRDMIGAEEQ